MSNKYKGGRSQQSRNEATGLTQEQRRELHNSKKDAYKRNGTLYQIRTVHRIIVKDTRVNI